MVAAVANANAAFFISEASVGPRNINRQSGYSFPPPPLAERFPRNLILMNGLGKRNHGARNVRSGSRLCENAINDMILLRFGRRIG
jgi:hypothetical protein